MTRLIDHIIRYAIFIIVPIVLFNGCKSARQAQSTTSSVIAGYGTDSLPDDVMTCFSCVVDRYGEWERLRIPVNLNLRSPKSASIGGTAIMERDKSVLISLKFIGMEVGALYVTTDSILVVDKVKKRYFLDSTSRLLGGFPVSISNLQDMLLGRAFRLGVSRLSSAKSYDGELEFVSGSVPRSWIFIPADAPDGIDYGFTFSPSDMLGALVIDVMGKVPVMCRYGAVANTPFGPFSKTFSVEAMAGKVDATLEWNFSKARWNSDVDLRNISVTSKYTRIEVADVSKILNY